MNGDDIQKKFDTLDDDIALIITHMATKEDVATLHVEVADIRSTLGSMETKIGSLETKIGSMEIRIGSMETNIGSMEAKIGTMETKIGTMEESMVTKDDLADMKEFFKGVLAQILAPFREEQLSGFAMSAQLAKHERWNRQIAGKLGLVLE